MMEIDMDTSRQEKDDLQAYINTLLKKSNILIDTDNDVSKDILKQIEHAKSFDRLKEIFKDNSKPREDLNTDIQALLKKEQNDPRLKNGIRMENRVATLITDIEYAIEIVKAEKIKHNPEDHEQLKKTYSHLDEHTTMIASERYNNFNNQEIELNHLKKQLNDNKHNPDKCKVALNDARENINVKADMSFSSWAHKVVDYMKESLKETVEKISEFRHRR
jgi:hypothetical protein